MDWEPQRPSAPSTPSSMSSQSTGNNGNRTEKIPTLKQISPSPSVSALSKLTDDELRRKGLEDLLRILRRVEADYKSLLGEHGNIVKDVNRRFQIFVLETRSLKEVNQKLQDDNQELRDLCCFLDDDRQRGRKLAREWQRFGRYTASVMRSEVAVYQEKLRELEDRQSELVTENMELKELCLYLDQERTRMTGDRDEGDGSSNGTVTGHEDGVVSMDTNGSITPTPNAPGPTTNSYPITSSSAASYIRELELKVHRLEEEKRLLAQRADRNSAEGLDVIPSSNDGAASRAGNINAGSNQSVHGSVPGSTGLQKSPVSSKPEAVVHAMKVLQVHEELEKTPTEDEDLDDPEKAIVREMCNVVWRKLGDVGDVGSFDESSDSILDPPFVPDSPGKLNTSMGTTSGAPGGLNPAHSYSIAQPQPQMASTPLSGGAKPSSLGSQFPQGTSEQLSSAVPYQVHIQRQERHHPLQPPQVSNPPSSSHHPYPQNQADAGMRNRQNSMSERLAAERSEDRRNPEQRVPPHYMSDTSRSANPQPSGHYPSHQQPPPVSHQQGHNQPDPRPHPMSARPSNPPSHYQQHQQRPLPPQNPPPVLPRHGNQRPGDSLPQSNQLHSGHHSDLPNPTNPHMQQQPQRNTQSHPHQPVKLLDAPGAHSYGGGDSGHQFQRPVPSQGSGPKRDIHRAEPTSHPQARPHSRGESMYEDRSSSERDLQSQPSLRSMSSSSASALNQPNSQMPAQNMPAAVSQQNLRGPAGFRAYPPQLSSVPTQPVSWRGPRGQDPINSGSNYHQDNSPRASQYQSEPTPRPGYASGPPTQNKGNPGGKRFLEQEWRQTYLDDSDTL